MAKIADTTAPETDAVEETPTESAAEAKRRKGVQLSTIIADPAIVADVELLVHATRQKTPSDVVRNAIVEYVANHQEDIDKYVEYFGIER
jgi:hypothetical protein